MLILGCSKVADFHDIPKRFFCSYRAFFAFSDQTRIFEQNPNTHYNILYKVQWRLYRLYQCIRIVNFDFNHNLDNTDQYHRVY